MPDDGVIDWLAADLIPNDRGFTLVGDANTQYVLSVDARLGDGFNHDGILGGIDFHWIVLNPTRFWEDLLEFLLDDLDDFAGIIKDNAAGRGGALV